MLRTDNPDARSDTSVIERCSSVTARSSRVAERRVDVLFAVLPFSPLLPALDTSTVAAAARLRGLSTRVAYFNRSYAAAVGEMLYDVLAARAPLESLAADWVFRDCVFGRTDPTEYLGMLIARGQLDAAWVPRLLSARRIAARFVAQQVAIVAARPPEVVCFLDTFAKRDAVAGQLMASLSFAQALRAAVPSVVTVLGGPFTEGVMGQTLTQLPFVDHVCTGRPTATVPTLLAELAAGTLSTPPAVLPRGFVSRSARDRRLDLPIPDFDDWFALRGDGLPGRFDTIPMETSTGCWWAERSHCRFCGLNGTDVSFRSKPADQVLHELDVLVGRHAPASVEMNDLIIDRAYLTDLFPALARRRSSLRIFYETRTSVGREALKVMAAAGVRSVQAGIESFSPTTVRRMGKGGSPRMSLRFLHDCRDVGIRCIWNYLHSAPGETPADLLEALPSIEAAAELQPPVTFAPVRIVRFSPYFARPSEHGLRGVRPDRSYAHVYAGSGLALDRLAYFFEHEDEADNRERRAAVARVGRALRAWQRRWDARERTEPLTARI